MSNTISTKTSPSAGAGDTRRAKRAGKRDVWLVFWIVPAFYTAFGVIFFALARVMPPPRPDVTTDQMVHFFHAHGLTIKIGFGVLVLILGGAGVANGIIVYHMKRMTVGSVLAYVSVWQIVTEILAVPVFVSKAGPFAWNGSISFWMGTVIFGFWLSCVIVFLMKANERQPVDEAPLD